MVPSCQMDFSTASSYPTLAARGTIMNLTKVTILVAVLIALGSTASAQLVSINTGSLGSAADGIHTPGVDTGLPGMIDDPFDAAVGYPNPDNGGNGLYRTEVAFHPDLNPSAGQPFTVEYWAEPWREPTTGPGPCPVFNRVGGSGNRSGWIFFQRLADTGWNFAMYSGNGSTIGIDLTGGTSDAFVKHHVVAVYDGTTASLYHNGVLVDQGSGPYTANTSGVVFGIGSYTADGVGDNSYRGVIDDLAIYNVALTPEQIQAHYQAAASQHAGRIQFAGDRRRGAPVLAELPGCRPHRVSLLESGQEPVQLETKLPRSQRPHRDSPRGAVVVHDPWQDRVGRRRGRLAGDEPDGGRGGRGS